MSNCRRARAPGGTYFFTINLLERRRRLLVEHVDLLGDAFRTTRAARPFVLLAWVILPDHLHCIWRLLEGDADNANRWAQIKAGFSRRLPATERRSAYRVSRLSAASRSGGIGNIWSAMPMTCVAMWTTSVTTR